MAMLLPALVGLAVAAVAIWLATVEWSWLSLSRQRRTRAARAIVDRWLGPGAYDRIDAQDLRRYGGRRP
ncbi:MAG: hypothetical protein JO038_08165 [Alphaproteobacteria bacterium]|nr:hypothetical protein [Alphaproteobacteria bacterium]